MQLRLWIVLGLHLGLSPLAAVAQTVSDRAADNADIRRSEQTRPGTATNKQAGGWDIEVSLPIQWSSNAIQTFGDQSNALGPPQTDWHVSPDILLRYSHQFTWLRLSAKVDLGEDRYFHQIGSNQDAAYATLKAEFTDGQSDRFVPYLAYTPEIDFLPFFAHWQDTLNDIYGGFTSGVGLHDGRFGRFRDATDPGDWSVLVDLSAGKRLASPSGFGNNFIRASLDIVYVANKQLAFWLTPAYRLRDYPDFFGESRHDNRLSAVVKAVWTPNWLTDRVKDAEIDFEAAWYKNYSTISNERYTVYEVGPTVFLAWHF